MEVAAVHTFDLHHCQTLWELILICNLYDETGAMLGCARHQLKFYFGGLLRHSSTLQIHPGNIDCGDLSLQFSEYCFFRYLTGISLRMVIEDIIAMHVSQEHYPQSYNSFEHRFG